jgi:hypothetical protein
MAMSEKATATIKTTDIKKTQSRSQNQRTERCEVTHSPVDQIFFLQKTIGNQAVQRLFKSGHLQAKLKIGQPNDIYEQEAERVADQVMRMPNEVVRGQQSTVSSKGEVGGLQGESLQMKAG